MKSTTRWVLILIAGLVLLLLPTAVSLVREQRAAAPAVNPAAVNPAGGYTPPAIATPALAATPIPTATPRESREVIALPTAPLQAGPVVVDLAHYSLIERAKFQPLAAALAAQGLDLRFWLPTVDTTDLQQITDFPDLSDELEKQVAGASALVVISPFFLYTPAEIAVVERFVADGGRLLLISDPDVESDSASDTNQLATAFNVIFNQDYLYDTVANDANFTYFFQGEFADQAETLAGSRIAFYGGRSISGAVVPQVRSAATTLSSLRNGLTSFNTVVLGGAVANGSMGRVLAMSDFDVLTDPYVARYDNRLILDFVGDFLAGAERANGMTDFPNFLGKEVALSIDPAQPVGALALSKAAELQRMLEENGRVLKLAAADPLSGSQPGPDVIYVAGYRSLDGRPDLLAELDLRLVEEIVTPTISATTVTPVATSTPEARPETEALPSDGEEPGHKGTPVAPVAPPEVPPLGTPTAAPEATPAATAETTPVVTATTDGSSSAARFFAQADTPTAAVTATVTAAETATVTAPVTDTATVVSTPPVAATAQVTETSEAVTGEAPAEATATPTPTPTPQIRLLLERGDGLRLLADETLLYVRRDQGSESQLLAVLGNSEAAINAALTRLLNGDFSGCLVQTDLIICPYSPGASSLSAAEGAAGDDSEGEAGNTQEAGAADDGEPTVLPQPGDTPAPDEPPAPQQESGSILIVDDNAGAGADEASEAAIYLTTLTEAGYTPDLWVIGEQGPPQGSDLIAYSWVIWSDAGYAASAIDGENLRVIGEYINQGGRLTISSRMPFFGVGPKSPSVIKDILVTDELPDLVEGLPTMPILLLSETPVLSPLEVNPDPEAGAVSAVARGPASADAGAPVLILMSDAGFDDPKGARLLLCGISMGWLPPEIGEQLIRNMADVMLAE